MSKHHIVLRYKRWQYVRRQVFERDGYRCVRCGRAGRLECDHIIPLEREPGQDPYAVDGCQALCRDCHIAKTATENRREPTPGNGRGAILWPKSCRGRPDMIDKPGAGRGLVEL